ncbi:hypothetical protein MGSAQ_001724 [marine sediment metagenome]|uniref:Uncharacterized protein n=1 Tax=marine sediment metagenome TaxID=412755 RepID=A0A1B6NTY4_9ZZZZ
MRPLHSCHQLLVIIAAPAVHGGQLLVHAEGLGSALHDRGATTAQAVAPAFLTGHAGDVAGGDSPLARCRVPGHQVVATSADVRAQVWVVQS